MHYWDCIYRALAECGVYMSALVWVACLFSTAAKNAENGAYENKAINRATKSKRFYIYGVLPPERDAEMPCKPPFSGWKNRVL